MRSPKPPFIEWNPAAESDAKPTRNAGPATEARGAFDGLRGLRDKQFRGIGFSRTTRNS